MIEVHVSSTGVLFSGSLGDGSSAFIDGDWLPEEESAVVEPLLWSEGELRYGAALTEVPADLSGQDAAAAAFRAMASESLGWVRDLAPQDVAVSGTGCIASIARRELGPPSNGERQSAPKAWIDFTGDMTQATTTVGDLGLVVLAGAGPDPGPVDLYRDVHVRSLRLVGVAPPLTNTPEFEGPPTASPRSVQMGVRCPPAPWYEIRES